jgi:hypothetical protein
MTTTQIAGAKRQQQWQTGARAAAAAAAHVPPQPQGQAAPATPMLPAAAAVTEAQARGSAREPSVLGIQCPQAPPCDALLYCLFAEMCAARCTETLNTVRQRR